MKKFFKRIGYALLILFVFINAICIWQAFTFTHISTAKISKTTGNKNIIEIKFDRLFGKEHPRQFVIDSLTIPHQTLYIQSDTIKLAAWYLKHNKDSLYKGTVIMFHGYQSSRSEVIPEATAFYNLGYNVFMIDFRAHGLSTGNACTMGYYEADDVEAAYNFIKATGEKNIIMWGGSMGAAAMVKAMYDDSAVKPSKIIIEKTFGTMTDAVKGLVKNTMHEPAQPISTLLIFWGSVEQGVWMFNMKPTLYVKKINCPALVQWGSDDEHVSKQETEEIYNNLGSLKKKLVIYPNCRHENLLLKQPVLWKSSVTDFLNS